MLYLTGFGDLGAIVVDVLPGTTVPVLHDLSVIKAADDVRRHLLPASHPHHLARLPLTKTIFSPDEVSDISLMKNNAYLSTPPGCRTSWTSSSTTIVVTSSRN